MTGDLDLRDATPADALVLGVLAGQVFLDTYATEGVSPALAREALSQYAPAVFEARLQDPGVQMCVALRGSHAVGFVDIVHASACPLPGVEGPEVFRLYVQRPFQGRGLGRALMARAQAAAAARGRRGLWLAAWAGNRGALAFYARLGFTDRGRTDYVIKGQAFENRVLALSFAG